jgi:hypothetical protein
VVDVNRMITVVLVLVSSLALSGVVSLGARGAQYGFGTVDQLSHCGAADSHIDHTETDTESDADYNWHPIAQITTSMNTVELFL